MCQHAPSYLCCGADVLCCRRWNNTVSLTLRSIIYDPIVEGCWIHNGRALPAGPPTPAPAAGAAGTATHRPAPAGTDSGSSTCADAGAKAGGSSSSCEAKPARVHPLQKLAGTAATFAVSGIMHEFVLLYALHDGNSYPAGFWFMFFFSQVREGCFWWGLMLPWVSFSMLAAALYVEAFLRSASVCWQLHIEATLFAALPCCHAVWRTQMPLLVLEDIARRRMRKSGVRPARPLLIGWTTVVLMISAYFFWYPPVEQYTDVALRVVTSVNASAASAVHGVQMLLQSLGLQQAAVGGAAFVGSVSL